MAPEALYQQLGRLIEDMPDLRVLDNYHPDTIRWLGRAYALVSEIGQIVDTETMRLACDKVTIHPDLRNGYAEQIESILYRALGVAELRAPIDSQGSFIPAKNAFDALAAVAKVLQSATQDVLIVDPYMDEKALTDFAVLAPEKTNIRLMADDLYQKPSLRPAVLRWKQQYATRPLEARLTPARTLHDRLIIVDTKTAYTLTQSLNAFAVRSPASIVRVDDSVGALKIPAYQATWNGATVIQ